MNEVQTVVQDVRLKKWANIIKEQNDSGLSVRAWCIKNEIAQGSFYYWLKKLRKIMIKQIPEEKQAEKFVPITIPVKSQDDKHSMIKINKNDLSIELSSDTPINTISTILEILQC